jgi:hypothetical protein
MGQASTPLTPGPKPNPLAKRPKAKSPAPESSLLVVRIKELDREFARQTKQLTALTKKLGKKIADKTIQTPKSPKKHS